MKQKIAVVGAGFAGAVIARELAESGRYWISVFDERDHVAGNCHTTRDEKSGVMIHHYGPHIFNTSRDDVWEYIQKWGSFMPYTNRVKAVTDRGVFSLPVNLLTINQFFNKQLNPREARDFLGSLGDQSFREPKNFEEQALAMVGRELYENFFKGYTKKQWGVDPRELPASILKRLPIRFNYNDNYYDQKYQGIPIDGYTAIVEKMLDHSHIEVKTSTRFERHQRRDFDHVFFSGPLDSWFDYKEGPLQYRSLIFKRFEERGDFQGNAVINYCQEKIPFTRITEHKHFAPWEDHENTVCFKEYSKLAEPGDIPYYPLRLTKDTKLLSDYVRLAQKEVGVSFVGRLATYRYLDMHVVIGESLDLAKQCLSTADHLKWPIFSRNPL